MLFRHALPAVREVVMERPTAARLLFFCAEHMSSTNILVTSQQTIAEYLGVSRSAVHRDIKYLKGKNIVDVIMIGSCPAIAVNAQLAWTSHANGRQYAALKGDILISKAEQTKPRAKGHKVLLTTATKEVPGQQFIPGTENL
jgi:predicted transcriptional regulator